MFGINKNGTKHKIGIIMPAFFPASRTTYDGATSGLSATRVQGAIDEVAEKCGNNCKIIDGTITNDFSGGNITKVNYPTGFTNYNCVVISSNVSYDNGSSWYPIRETSTQSDYVYIESGGIFIFNGNANKTGWKYRIALAKFS